MYKRILVPLDGSALAEKALSHAKITATAFGPSEIDLIFVVQTPDTTMVEELGDIDKAYFSQLDKKAEVRGKDYLAKVTQDLKKDGITAQSTVLRGNPAEMILDFAKKNAIDLIVMCSHGRSGLSRWAFGSVAEKVLSTSTSPVLIVRPEK